MRMMRWMRWHCPPDTGFEIRALAVWGLTRYLSVTETPHNIAYFTSKQRRNISFLWNLKARVEFEPAISDFPNQAALTTAPVLIRIVRLTHSVERISIHLFDENLLSGLR